MNKFRSALLALALLVGGLVSAPAVATAGPVQPAASYQCVIIYPGPPPFYSRAVDCTVYSGRIRFWVRCSDGRTLYTPWTGIGRWYFVLSCYPATVVASGIQFIG